MSFKLWDIIVPAVIRDPVEFIDIPEEFEADMSLSTMRTRRSPRRFDDSDPNAEAKARDEPKQRKQRKRTPKLKQKKPTRAQRRLQRIISRRQAEAWDEAPAELLLIDAATEPDLVKAIVHGYEKDTLFSKVISAISHYADFKLRTDGLLFHRLRPGGLWRVCLPNSQLKQRSIREIYLEHFHVATGHLGMKRLTNALTQHVWWPSLSKDVTTYVNSCPSCQACKRPTEKPTGLLHSLPIPVQPWDSVGIDFMGPFPPSRLAGQTHDFLMVAIDQLTGEVELIPTTSQGLDAKETARLYFANIYPRHGLPSNIVSDRDVRFTSEFWRALHDLMGTTLSMSTAYHPQSNGKTERANRTINSIMRHFVNEEQTDWANMLPMAQFAINSTVSEVTGNSPFELNRGYTQRSLPLRIDWSRDSPVLEDAAQFADNAQKALLVALDGIIYARAMQTYHANKGRRASAAAIQPGDLYWLSTRNLSIVQGRAYKWTPRFVGPFEVVHFWSKTDTVELDLPERYTSRGISKVFHISEVKPFISSDATLFPNRLTTRVPTFPMDTLEMEVLRIVTHRVTKDSDGNSTVELLVQFKSQDSTWMPTSHPDLQVAGSYKDDYLARVRAKDLSELNEENIPVRTDLTDLVPIPGHADDHLAATRADAEATRDTAGNSPEGQEVPQGTSWEVPTLREHGPSATRAPVRATQAGDPIPQCQGSPSLAGPTTRSRVKQLDAPGAAHAG
jgi:transposase InsO family protein